MSDEKTIIEQELEAMTADRDALKAENAALAAKLAKAEKRAKNTATPRAPSARNVAAIKRAVGAAEPSPAELLEAIAAADDVEVAFSDGKREIRHLPAFGVSGEGAWAVTPAGLVLTVPLTVHPQSASTVRGYGLFLDGKLAAYRPRMDALEIPAGREQSLTGDVVF